ncbi:hypothetical protein ALI144C_36590 [Actinosynnema sp. ALI-1.44]|uniref:hypothetical protein n=1 Tax=Actinosynnema sp. ALI-1.44 TaxID=1933779 RepID=UPI00097C03DC|nr:hypothetical protein [Actinosynnema sp. ALI-1.44]ONI76195.1 hypothetical protein ALI144C_36590 [Actinosynnema sp. ALI-1.44]
MRLRHRVVGLGHTAPAAGSVTTPERVRRMRELTAAAARGESLLLCAEPREPVAGAMRATADLATLGAFVFAYATGRPVPTVLAVSDSHAEPGTFAGDRLVHHEGPIGRAHRWLAGMAWAPRLDTAESAFLTRLIKAWGFAMAYGGEPAEVARMLTADQFSALPLPGTVSPLVRQTTDGSRYSLVSPGVFVGDGTGRPAGEQAGDLVNTVVLRLRRGLPADELARLCARFDPDRVPGKLVVLVPPLPDRRLAAYVTAAGGQHMPTWVLGPGSGPGSGARLRRMHEVLAGLGAHLGGVWLDGRGRRLEQIVRLATVISSQHSVPILDRTA